MNPVSIDRLGDDNWQTLRDLRLAALQDSPHAFWAKLSDERRYSVKQWTSFLGAVAWFVARRGDGAPSVWPGCCNRIAVRS